MTGGPTTDLVNLGETAWQPSWSPDGSRLTVVTDAGQLLSVRRTGEELARADWPRPFRACWSPDGRAVAVGGRDGTVGLLDPDLRELRRWQGHQGGFYAVAWSACGRVLASGGKDKVASLWQPQDGSEAAALEGHVRDVNSLSFAPGGGLLASASDDGTIRLWDVADLAGPAQVRREEDAASAYARRQAATVGRITRVRAGANDNWVPRLDGANDATGCLGVLRGAGRDVALSPDGRTLFAADNGAVRRFDLRSGDRRWDVPLHDVAYTWTLRASPCGRLVGVSWYGGVSVLAADSGALRWHAPTPGTGTTSPGGLTAGGAEARAFDLPAEPEGCAWSPDGLHLAVAAWDGVVRVLDAVSGACRHTLRGHGAGVQGVAWSADGSRLASCGDDHTARVWDWRRDQEVTCFQGHGDNVYDVAWSPDGLRLATPSHDRSVRVWDAVAGRPLRRFDHQSTDRVCWSPTGTFLASSGTDGNVHLWDVRQPDAVATVPISAPSEVPAPLCPLPSSASRLARVGIHAPLGLLRGLLDLTAGRSLASLASLASHPNLAHLMGLRWPEPARCALAALLLRGCPLGGEWTPPVDLPPSRLRGALAAALADAEDGQESPWPCPLPSIRKNMDAVDAGLVALLRQLGPAAAATDPAIVLRLVGRPRTATPPSAVPRHPRPAEGSARAIGSTSGRSGVGQSGAWPALLPWQHALPAEALAARHRQGTLLFRQGPARPDAAGPLVLLVDASPASAGPTAAAARACALWAASVWLGRGLPVWLAAAGGPTRLSELRGADLASWPAPSPRPVRAAEALTAAERVRSALAVGGAPGCVLLLAGPRFGWGEEPPTCRHLRAAFLRPTADRSAPTWARACARWAVADAPDHAACLAAVDNALG